MNEQLMACKLKIISSEAAIAIAFIGFESIDGVGNFARQHSTRLIVAFAHYTVSKRTINSVHVINGV